MAQNRDAVARNPTFTVLRGGLAAGDTFFPGAAADGVTQVAWQDTSMRESSLGLQIFQRTVAAILTPGMMSLFSLTSDQNDLASLSRELGFDPPGGDSG